VAGWLTGVRSSEEPGCHVACTARVVLFYLGVSACPEILDNTQYPRGEVDCSGPYEVDDYWVLANGSIGGATSADGDCEDVAVQGETWGAIKSFVQVVVVPESVRRHSRRQWLTLPLWIGREPWESGKLSWWAC